MGDMGHMGKICVLYGEKDRSRSSTIKEIFEILDKEYPNCIDPKSILKPNIIVEMHKDSGFVRDIKKVSIIRSGVERIGIASQGNNKTTLKKTLTDFAKHKCEIIFCTEKISSKIFAELKGLNKKNKDSILKKTAVGKWVEGYNRNQPYHRDKYQITHILQQKVISQAEEMIKKAELEL